MKKRIVLLLALVMSATLTCGSVTAEEAGSPAAEASAYGEGDSVSRSFESVTADTGAGVAVSAEDGGTAYVEVSGDVSVSGPAGETGEVTGTEVYGGTDASAEAEIGGNVQVSSENDDNAAGISLLGNGGKAEAEVEGDVTVSAEGGNAEGISVQSNVGGKAEADVDGGITVSADTGDASGIAVLGNGGDVEIEVNENVAVTASDGKAEGIRVSDAERSGNIDVEAKSDVTASGPSGSGSSGITVNLSPGKGSKKTAITVGGDVSGTDAGLTVNSVSEKGTSAVADVTIKGTLKSGSGTAVLLSEGVTADNLNLTVWKIEGDVLQAAGDSGEPVSNDVTKAVEEKIRYIIAIKSGQEDIFDGTAETAGAGETVTVKINVPSGYKLNGAFNGKDERVPLLKNADGSYYVKVPKGGGVYLSVSLSYVPDYSSFCCRTLCVQAVDMVKVRYELDGGLTKDGEEGPIEKKVPAGTRMTLPEEPVKEGYVFDSWKCDDKDIKVSLPKEEFVAEKDLVFTAVWKENPERS